MWSNIVLENEMDTLVRKIGGAFPLDVGGNLSGNLTRMMYTSSFQPSIHLVSLPNVCIFSHMIFLWHYTDFFILCKKLATENNRDIYQGMGNFVIGNWWPSFRNHNFEYKCLELKFVHALIHKYLKENYEDTGAQVYVYCKNFIYS